MKEYCIFSSRVHMPVFFWRACTEVIPEKQTAIFFTSPPCLHKEYCMTYTVKILEMLFLKQLKVVQFIRSLKNNHK